MEEKAKIYCIDSSIKNDKVTYCHWSDGLKMIIIKNGVKIKLSSEEIKELVNCLPRTVGNTY